VDQEAEEG